jgi:hypothetical protein
MNPGNGKAWIGASLTFATEIGMLIAFGVWGYTTLDGALGWGAAIGLPAIVATVWGVYLSPKASHPIPVALTQAFRAALFLFAVALLYVAGLHGWSFALGGIAIAGLVLSALWPLTLPPEPARVRHP